MENGLNASKAGKRPIRIFTKHPDDTNFDGIVLQNAKSFVAFLRITDFEPDGIVVVPKKWLKEIRDGKFEACVNEVMRFSDVLERGDVLEWPSNITGLLQIFAHLKEDDIWPAVKIVYSSGSPMYFGRITKLSKKSMAMYCYDAAGEWEKEYEIDFAEIFRIEIESRYTKHFNAYMKTRPKPPPSGRDQ